MNINIFISYSHDDMRKMPGEASSRIGEIFERICYDLKCHSKRSPFKLIQDCKELLHAGDFIPEAIADGIKKSDMALVLFSENYSRSDSCLDELQQFIEQKKRVIIVEAEPFWTQAFEETIRASNPNLGNLLRAQFWKTDYSGGKKLIGDPLPSRLQGEEFQAYNEKIRFAVGSVRNVYEDFKRKARQNPLDALEGGAGQMVLIADPTPDVRPEARRLQETLGNQGYTVMVFDASLYRTGKEQEDAFKLAVSKSRVLVQLLGRVPGRELGLDKIQANRFQHDVMKQSGKPFELWQQPDLDKEFEHLGLNYQEFLKTVHPHSFDYEDFEIYIEKKVKDFAESEPSRSRPEPLVCIDFAKQDKDIALTIRKELNEKSITTSHLSDDLDSKTLKQTVLNYDGMVMLFCSSRESRIRVLNHLGLIQRYKSTNKSACCDLAIGDGQSEDIPPSGPGLHVFSIDADNRLIEPEKLDRFVENIKANAEKRCH